MPDPSVDPIGAYWANTSGGATDLSAGDLSSREEQLSAYANEIADLAAHASDTPSTELAQLRAYFAAKYVLGGSVTTPVVAGITLPGTAGNYVSSPDSVALSVSGDCDLRAKVKLTDWTSANVLIAKWDAVALSYLLQVNADGTLQAAWLPGSFTTAVSNAPLGITDGTTKWVRAVRVASTGAMTLYTSDDGSSWSTVASTPTGAVAGNLNDTARPVVVGVQSDGSTGQMTGTVYRAMILSGGTVADFDPAQVTKLGTRSPATYTDPQGNVWTINGSAWDWV